MRVSIALAAYDGGRFIKQQLESVLAQLGAEDEVVVSLPEGDSAEKVIEALGDGRVRTVRPEGVGIIKNFEKAVSECGGDVIFLCDQDDVWMPDKVERVCAVFYEKQPPAVVVHDALLTDEELNITGETLFSLRSSRAGTLKNLWRNSYAGCCMAFDARMKPYILPFPQGIPMHDQWIGLVSQRMGGARFIKEKLILYRRHSGSVTLGGHGSLGEMIKGRVGIVSALLKGRVGR